MDIYGLDERGPILFYALSQPFTIEDLGWDDKYSGFYVARLYVTIRQMTYRLQKVSNGELAHL
jgi:hypothetical protein